MRCSSKSTTVVVLRLIWRESSTTAKWRTCRLLRSRGVGCRILAFCEMTPDSAWLGWAGLLRLPAAIDDEWWRWWLMFRDLHNHILMNSLLFLFLALPIICDARSAAINGAIRRRKVGGSPWQSKGFLDSKCYLFEPHESLCSREIRRNWCESKGIGILLMFASQLEL